MGTASGVTEINFSIERQHGPAKFSKVPVCCNIDEYFVSRWWLGARWRPRKFGLLRRKCLQPLVILLLTQVCLPWPFPCVVCSAGDGPSPIQPPTSSCRGGMSRCPRLGVRGPGRRSFPHPRWRLPGSLTFKVFQLHFGHSCSANSAELSFLDPCDFLTQQLALSYPV